MSSVLIYCDCHERLNFYHALSTNCKFNDREIVLLSDRYSVHLKGVKLGYKSYWINKSDCRLSYDVDISRTIEVIGGFLTIKQANLLFASIVSSIETLCKNNIIDYVIIWNGESIAGEAIRALKSNEKYKTLYMEISNLPGLAFCNSYGVNARSSLYENDEVLDSVDLPSPEEFLLWREKYYDNKKKNALVPQVRFARKINLSAVVDSLFAVMFSRPQITSQGIVKRLFNALSRAKVVVPGLKYSLQDRYVFLPLQVTSDTQLKINSDFDNYQALEYALNLSSVSDSKLIVKIHPAEGNVEFIRKLMLLAESKKFLISNQDTLELLEKSDAVVVINSTVGLEALILGKEIRILGRALYSNFDQGRLRKYILRYLIELDYFNPKQLNTIDIERLLSYAG